MFTVWSPFDGQPLPAPNEVERDILLSHGYLAEPPAATASPDSEPADTDKLGALAEAQDATPQEARPVRPDEKP